MTTVTLIASIFSLLLTLGVFWTNPHRFSNQAFAVISLIQTIWLACVYRAMQASSINIDGISGDLETWLRTNAAVLSFLPASLSVLKSAITSNRTKYKAFISASPLLLLGIASASLCYTELFLFEDYSGSLRRGILYYIYSAAAICLYFIFVIQVVNQTQITCGIRRVELQFLALNAGGAALLMGTLNALGNLFYMRVLNSLSVLVLLAASALTAWALLFHRVFNTREVLLQIAQRGSFIAALSIGTFALWQVAHIVVAEPFGLLLSIGVCGSAAVWLDRKSREWFERGNRRKLQRLRQAAIDSSSSEIRTDSLIARLEKILQAEYETPTAVLLFDKGESFEGAGIDIDKKRVGSRKLLEEGWTTPESILRRKPTKALEDLRTILEEHEFGVMVTAPRNSPAPTMILSLRVRYDAAPFTYPEVERLQSIAELFNSLVMRSRLASQAAMQARMEYLAMASRGLAHDLKNLITPVSSFLVHTDRMFPTGTPEGAVHSTARQAMQVITEYVRESLFFSEKLTPRFEPVEIHELFTSVRSLVQGRALAEGVSIIITASTSTGISGDKVLLQRMMVNLVSNALDASKRGTAITMGVRTSRPGWIQLTLADQGTGICRDDLARIFDPYFTTREFGSEARGFGLGLTIVQKIVLLHSGTIAVHSEEGTGTRFTIDLPTEQRPLPLSPCLN